MISSCEKDSIINDDTDLKFELSSFAKVDICHKGKIINVSINALSAHKKHGDAVDIDGDGHFDLEKECSEIDCNDSNSNLNPDTEEICDNGIDDNCDGNIDQDCGINCDIVCANDSIICDYFNKKTTSCYSLISSGTLTVMFNDETYYRLYLILKMKLVIIIFYKLLLKIIPHNVEANFII